MGNKNYTKYSENSNNNDSHIVSPELEQTVLDAGGEVMRIDQENIVIEGVNEIPEDADVLDAGGEVMRIDQENIVIEGVNEIPEDADVIDNVVLPIENVVLKGVVNTGRLNVRKQPSKDSEVLEVITKNSEVEIGLDGETDTFYKVRTKSGVEGYCMKDFLDIK